MFLEAKNALVFKKANETLMIEPWGKDSFRVRSTLEAAAPIVDAIVIETTAVLQWDHVMGLPVTSNYAPRNPSEY